MAITCLFLNLMKHHWIPACLQHQADFVNGPHTLPMQKEFMQNMIQVHAVSVLNQYKLAGCAEVSGLSTAQNEQLWLAGKIDCDDPSFAKAQKQYTISQCAPPFEFRLDINAWRPVNIYKIEKILQEMETLRGKKFRQCNAAPVFWAGRNVPEDYKWWMAWNLVGERLERMFIWCNKDRIHDDTITTIFLTICFTLLDHEIG